MFLVNSETGMGIDFDILDWIQTEDKVYVVLMPASLEDRKICSEMMEPSQEGSGEWDVCILEAGEDQDGRGQFLRVEGDTLDQVFQLFRQRNQDRFRF